ncbi:ras and ef-hand domain-containing protein [Anaeramoeba flamelloides]|uniref:Ras and ef-hand domain-containing protein n=1 Tax=Anaeramoeba flamelloides TaxID=1746091 RepID=A0AAV7ZE01_9EUKA|nr:ras and ef-hand domain-containing protein [Anaeramoeba flamelloides]KAJ6240060.1 ras and ef-hand domain-containing protein [Anaeramoeba flamelloides]
MIDQTNSPFKIVLLGDSSVGKSSLVLRLCQDKFVENLEPTIGGSCIIQNIEIEESEVKLKIWDTAGQERFHSLTPLYYRGAKGAVIVYDISNFESFERAKDWILELRENGESDSKIVLVGNKIDLETKAVEDTTAQKFADKNGLLFFETSAKTGEFVNQIFLALAKLLLGKNSANSEVQNGQTDQIPNNENDYTDNNFGSQNVNLESKEPKENSGCC